MKKHFLFLVLIGICFHHCRTPEAHFKNQIQEPVDLPYHSGIEKIKKEGDPIRAHVSLPISELPPQDEIILQEDLNRAFVASMDGWIWKIDLKEKTSVQYVRTPLLPGGMVEHPKNKDIIFFCVSRGKKDDPVEENGPGIYELTISTKSIRKIGTRVPLAPKDQKPKEGQIGVLYPFGKDRKISFTNMNSANSRNVEKADDLAISKDGERIYFTEPYDHPGAILGVSPQSRSEVLTLGRNGHLWKYDLKEQSASLVAYQYSYLDGILLEYGEGEKETGIIVNELSKSRLLRLHLTGDKAGLDEIVIEGLPGFPDGMDRDTNGRIWIALVTERSKLVTWFHKHPFWKSLLLYVPDRLLPVSRKTGIIALSPDGSKPLYYSMHSGNLFSNIIVVVPGKDRLYLAIYQEGYKGLTVMDYPDELK
ncbi:hypothetical protein [Leptospira ilyithenensis]|uniref:SMP-30/gluconolaconase/LRE-like region n=1 Tax=Leptospira ilyithenensis TaxID=2484901 RepID=A0A4R9LMJ4_9LEPT|nr:hypothetical protein [Leptospira ilyithenensis]TGN09782.1 hypothetical protein EHS11_11915 [Leptospira ilyithenensis]